MTPSGEHPARTINGTTIVEFEAHGVVYLVMVDRDGSGKVAWCANEDDRGRLPIPTGVMAPLLKAMIAASMGAYEVAKSEKAAKCSE